MRTETMAQTSKKLTALLLMNTAWMVLVIHHVVYTHTLSNWWYVGPMFVLHQILCAVFSLAWDHPAFERVYGSLYMRFKISHDWLYVTNSRGHRNNMLLP